MLIRVVSQLDHDRFLAQAYGLSDEYRTWELVRAEALGTTIIWDIAKPANYDWELSHYNPPPQGALN